jgi:hypothetical protein
MCTDPQHIQWAGLYLIGNSKAQTGLSQHNGSTSLDMLQMIASQFTGLTSTLSCIRLYFKLS